MAGQFSVFSFQRMMSNLPGNQRGYFVMPLGAGLRVVKTYCSTNVLDVKTTTIEEMELG